ncbi:hypothetical protein [Vibrio splendidus]|uniref:hypothetical protein n=1 Tax=Vibrio splendidus TaxID=29497 RepID=UPI001C06C968|nr:hypothetical protein [Vibrio splendidus]MBU2910048.1 hypothetical protein [Vibrio splendidus]MDO6531421.1 hypothetical protein [Vibrio splendidus]MDO6552669.1 hypothetical protein [Vibrio splendidus]
MERIQLLRKEALSLRYAMEASNKDSLSILSDRFPIMNCRVASMLLAFHYFQTFCDIEITCVSGYGENLVTHVWLEVNDLVVDITGDQYNTINDIELNDGVIRRRPYPKVHVERTDQSYLPHLFKRTERLSLDRGFSGFKAHFVGQMKSTYSLLIIT